MLNAGLSTLTILKSRILPAAATTETTWDAALSTLGLAVARRMENYCQRYFDYLAGAVDSFSAYTLGVTLKRYPVLSITSVVCQDNAGQTATLAAGDYTLDTAAGMLSFETVPGMRAERLVITYTGGFWLEATGLPTGATALPADLLEAWIAEVQLQAEARGTFEALGLRAQKDGKAKPPAGLSEETLEILRPYRRFSGE
jgi:hypothetical protein